MVILSGGPNSVHEEGSPSTPPGFFEWAAGAGVPVLGICYGMQLLVQCLGGEVAPAEKREYGRMPITTTAGSLFPEAGSQMVWMSHGDEAKRLPDGFAVVATSEQGALVAIECVERKMYGLQYHPEVRSACSAQRHSEVTPCAGDSHGSGAGDAAALSL